MFCLCALVLNLLGCPLRSSVIQHLVNEWNTRTYFDRDQKTKIISKKSLGKLTTSQFGKSEYIITTNKLYDRIRQAYIDCDHIQDFTLDTLTNAVVNDHLMLKQFANVHLYFHIPLLPDYNPAEHLPHTLRLHIELNDHRHEHDDHELSTKLSTLVILDPNKTSTMKNNGKINKSMCKNNHESNADTGLHSLSTSSSSSSSSMSLQLDHLLQPIKTEHTIQTTTTSSSSSDLLSISTCDIHTANNTENNEDTTIISSLPTTSISSSSSVSSAKPSRARKKHNTKKNIHHEPSSVTSNHIV